jgi:predicted nucleotidyltransferase
MTKQRVLTMLSENKESIQKLGVVKLELFGSSARDEVREDSDLDFIVEFEKKTFDSYMDLKFFLENLFKRPIDLVLSDSVKPRLRSSIAKETVYAA